MRILKLIAAVGLVMAATGAAWAETIPYIPTGPVSMQSRNQDSGTTYTFTDFASLPDGYSVTFNPHVSIPSNVAVIACPGGVSGEDSWGIAVLYYMAHGQMTGLGTPGSTVTSDTPPEYYNNGTGSQATWLTSAFYGGTDVSVTLKKVGSLIAATIDGAGMKFKLYAVDKTALDVTSSQNDLVAFDASKRTAADAYTGWVGPSVGGTLLAEATNAFYHSSYGYNPATGHLLSTIPGSGGQSSFNTTYWQLDETQTTLPWNVYFGTNGIRNDFQDPAGNQADVYFTWGLQDSPQGWTAKSQDFGGTDSLVVPEPLTFVGAFLGITGLGGYIRRRMHAA